MYKIVKGATPALSDVAPTLNIVILTRCVIILKAYICSRLLMFNNLLKIYSFHFKTCDLSPD